MRKQNKLYPNKDNAQEFEEGSTCIVIQPIVMYGKKVCIEAIVRPENLFLQFVELHETSAIEILKALWKKVSKDKNDLPHIYEEDNKVELLHHAFAVILFSYCSIETYINSFIELNLSVEEKNRMKSFESSLQGRIQLLSTILKVTHYKEVNAKNREIFKELETMRDHIAHSRYSYFNNQGGTDWSKLLLSKVFNGKFKTSKKIAIDIIEYYRRFEPSIPSDILKISERGLQGTPVKD